MIRIQISKSTGDITHIDEQGRKTVIRDRGRDISLNRVKMDCKARGLKIKRSDNRGGIRWR